MHKTLNVHTLQANNKALHYVCYGLTYLNWFLEIFYTLHFMEDILVERIESHSVVMCMNIIIGKSFRLGSCDVTCMSSCSTCDGHM